MRERARRSASARGAALVSLVAVLLASLALPGCAPGPGPAPSIGPVGELPGDCAVAFVLHEEAEARLLLREPPGPGQLAEGLSLGPREHPPYRLFRSGAELRSEGFELGAAETSLGEQPWFRDAVARLGAQRAQREDPPDRDRGVELHADLTRVMPALLRGLSRGPGSELLLRSLGLESLLTASAFLDLELVDDAVLSAELDLNLELARAPIGLVRSLTQERAAPQLHAELQGLPADYDFVWLRMDLADVLAQEARTLSREGGALGGIAGNLLGMGRRRLPLLSDAALRSLGDEYLWVWPRGSQPLDVLKAQIVVTVRDPAALLAATEGLELEGWTGFAVAQGGDAEDPPRHRARLRLAGKSYALELSAGDSPLLRLGSVSALRKPLPRRTGSGLVESELEGRLAPGQLLLVDWQLPGLGFLLRELPAAWEPLLGAKQRVRLSVRRRGGELLVTGSSRAR